MKKTLFILFVFLAFQGVHAEEKRSFWDHGFGKFLKKADNMVKGWEASGIDTNYIRPCEKDRFFYLGGYSYYQQHDMDFPISVEESELPQSVIDKYGKFIPSNFADNRYVNMDMHTIQAELELGIDWRGITLELPIPILNKYNKSFGLAKNGSVWGFRIRFKELNKMTGVIDNAFGNMFSEVAKRYGDYLSNPDDPSKAENTSPYYSQSRTIPDDDMTLRIFYVEGYYVFNHKHFCLSAGAYGDMVQLRPAGSLFAWLNYFQSSLHCNNTFNSEWDTFRNNKVSLGLGYGYNIPFLKGKGCIHMSIIPLFSVYNHLTHTNAETNQSTETDSVWDAYDRHFYDAANYGKDSGFSVNGLVKFAVSYSHKRMVYNLLMNYRQFMFNTSSKFNINDREADFQFNIGYRF